LEASGAQLPRIFCVNWFQTDENGKFIWPGFGENMRILKWMLERVEGGAKGHDNLFGISPGYEDITWEGLDFGADKFERITAIDTQAWRKELSLHAKLFERLKQRLPSELSKVQSRLVDRLDS